MSSRTPEFLIFKRDSSRRLDDFQQDDPAYIVIASAWNTAVKILIGDPGRRAIQAHAAASYVTGSSLQHPNCNEATTRFFTHRFTEILTTSSPMLVHDDALLANIPVTAVFDRRAWSGSYGAFNVQEQAIKINPHWVRVAVVNMAEHLQDRNHEAKNKRFQLAQLRIVQAFIHEMGHLLQTFIGQGPRAPPVYLDVRGISRYPNLTGFLVSPDAGDYMEHLIFGGLLDFCRDDRPADQPVTSFPWVIKENQRAYRVEMQSIGLLLRPDWTATPPDILRLDTRYAPVPLARLEDGRVVSAVGIPTNAFSRPHTQTLPFVRPTANLRSPTESHEERKFLITID